MTVIKWAWRHWVLEGDEFDTLDEAVSAAWGAAEYGLEALESIEVFEADGSSTVLDPDAVRALQEPLDRAEHESYEAALKSTHVVDAQAPGGQWTAWASAISEAEADAAADRLRAILGPDRVKVRTL